MFVASPSTSTSRTPTGYVDALAVQPISKAGHLLDPVSMTKTTIEFGRDAEIIAQGCGAEYCFHVVAGCARTVKLLEDGRRQVGAFLFAGNFFGWETLGEHEFAVEAVTRVTLRRFRLSALDDHAASDPAFGQRLRQYLIGQVRVARDHLVLLGRKTAAERIASFLLEMTERLPGSGDRVIDVPMSRVDMADYLGLTIETVCRGLAELRRQGTIAVDRPKIVILDRQALGLAGSDRLH